MKFGRKLKCNVFYKVRDNLYFTDMHIILWFLFCFETSLFFLQDIVSVISEILYK